MAKKVYAVVRGRIPGIYHDWNSCFDQVKDIKGSKLRGFKTQEEAQQWFDDYTSKHGSGRIGTTAAKGGGGGRNGSHDGANPQGANGGDNDVGGNGRNKASMNGHGRKSRNHHGRNQSRQAASDVVSNNSDVHRVHRVHRQQQRQDIPYGVENHVTSETTGAVPNPIADSPTKQPPHSDRTIRKGKPNSRPINNNNGKGGKPQKWFAVAHGRKPGVYKTYPECLAQTKGFSRAVFKSFFSREEAENFLVEYIAESNKKPDRGGDTNSSIVGSQVDNDLNNGNDHQQQQQPISPPHSMSSQNKRSEKNKQSRQAKQKNRERKENIDTTTQSSQHSPPQQQQQQQQNHRSKPSRKSRENHHPNNGTNNSNNFISQNGAMDQTSNTLMDGIPPNHSLSSYSTSLQSDDVNGPSMSYNQSVPTNGMLNGIPSGIPNGLSNSMPTNGISSGTSNGMANGMLNGVPNIQAQAPMQYDPFMSPSPILSALSTVTTKTSTMNPLDSFAPPVNANGHINAIQPTLQEQQMQQAQEEHFQREREQQERQEKELARKKALREKQKQKKKERQQRLREEQLQRQQQEELARQKKEEEEKERLRQLEVQRLLEEEERLRQQVLLREQELAAVAARKRKEEMKLAREEEQRKHKEELERKKKEQLEKERREKERCEKERREKEIARKEEEERRKMEEERIQKQEEEERETQLQKEKEEQLRKEKRAKMLRDQKEAARLKQEKEKQKRVERAKKMTEERAKVWIEDQQSRQEYVDFMKEFCLVELERLSGASSRDDLTIKCPSIERDLEDEIGLTFNDLYLDFPPRIQVVDTKYKVFHGRTGTIVGWNKNKGKYKVALDTKKQKVEIVAILPESLEPASSTTQKKKSKDKIDYSPAEQISISTSIGDNCYNIVISYHEICLLEKCYKKNSDSFKAQIQAQVRRRSEAEAEAKLRKEQEEQRQKEMAEEEQRQREKNRQYREEEQAAYDADADRRRETAAKRAKEKRKARRYNRDFYDYDYFDGPSGGFSSGGFSSGGFSRGGRGGVSFGIGPDGEPYVYFNPFGRSGPGVGFGFDSFFDDDDDDYYDYEEDDNNKVSIEEHAETLGIAPDATVRETKSAFRKKALKFHPDKYQDPEHADGMSKEEAEEHFKQCSAAYEYFSEIHYKEEDED